MKLKTSAQELGYVVFDINRAFTLMQSDAKKKPALKKQSSYIRCKDILFKLRPFTDVQRYPDVLEIELSKIEAGYLVQFSKNYCVILSTKILPEYHDRQTNNPSMDYMPYIDKYNLKLKIYQKFVNELVV